LARTVSVSEYVGVWRGVAPRIVDGPVTVMVTRPDPAAPATGSLEVEAFGQGMPIARLDVARDGLHATVGPIELVLHRDGSVLRARIRSDLLPELEVDLRRVASIAGAYGDVAEGRCGLVDDAVLSGELPWVDGLVVRRAGDVLIDRSYGRHPESLRSVQSATKSITSLLFGSLVASGQIDLQAPAADYLQARTGTRWIDERYDITVHDVLSMSAGLRWNEQATSYVDPDNDAVRMNAATDWIGYVLDRPPAERAAGEFEYQSGLSLLMGEILASVTSRPVPDLAREQLFAPMGIERFHWMAHADGTAHTGGGLWLTPSDFAKLGQLVLDDGAWNGEQLVPASWVKASTAAQSSPSGEPPFSPHVVAYGYQWWLLRTPVRDGTIESISALGHGGQILHVLPADRTVVAMTGHDWLGGPGTAAAVLRLLYGYDGDRAS
jgi:CubicO group peptidase (beta-lactamase class C family)